MDDLARLDLNMLTALRALLEERSVSRAAARLGVGQPAASSALQRLRTHFDDPLLVRSGNTFELSALAASLLGAVEQALATAEEIFLRETRFDPKTSTRTFRIMVADVALVGLGELLIPAMTDAPEVRLDFVALTDAAIRDIEQTLRAVDALVVPRGIIAGFPAMDLWTERWVFMVGERAAVGSRLTKQRLEQMTWITTYHGGTSPVAATFEAWNIRSRIRVTVPSYVVLPMLLASSTEHVAIVQESLARRLEPLGGVRVFPAPPEAADRMVALWWHPTHERDAGHAWLRQRILEVSEDRREGRAGRGRRDPP
ncbi:LysR family transcriptional regulator [Phytohabitans sp. ZYX-F-186]|uniref:LysR family transcriptional regulator n=1 Tax=Phytohabitans maris TaxID=3071409 RepID=A0ABU0ZPQ9_9ACTN|nr:LysR family transcriptional regulator [Phytohabitans sp. ZYX-F-186]MDQ7909029.1 LysR family transcriptional regulator [Phytohabitans sp. ZYX-F-186]